MTREEDAARRAGQEDDSAVERDGETADRLRADIDGGESGDKVGHPDPSAAPLGTDAEAGGAPPTSEEVSQARSAEIEGRTAAPVADPGRPISADRPGDPATNRGGLDAPEKRYWTMTAVIAAVAVIILLWIIL